MATVKRRINISTDIDMENSLVRAARRDRVPIATKAAELLRLALEIEEDLALATIADIRSRVGGRFVSHKVAWR